MSAEIERVLLIKIKTNQKSRVIWFIVNKALPLKYQRNVPWTIGRETQWRNQDIYIIQVESRRWEEISDAAKRSIEKLSKAINYCGLASHVINMKQWLHVVKSSSCLFYYLLSGPFRQKRGIAWRVSFYHFTKNAFIELVLIINIKWWVETCPLFLYNYIYCFYFLFLFFC